MSKHNEIGLKGELIAADFLKNKGYLIKEMNWRYGQKELDIIASVNNQLVFVEVKTRKSAALSFPEETLNFNKKNNLKTAAAFYFEQNTDYFGYRFDIIAIIYSNGAIREIYHFENAF
jgi:putative endonuclease